jgi:hypothetical protein
MHAREHLKFHRNFAYITFNERIALMRLLLHAFHIISTDRVENKNVSRL